MHTQQKYLMACWIREAFIENYMCQATRTQNWYIRCVSEEAMFVHETVIHAINLFIENPQWWIFDSKAFFLISFGKLIIHL